MWILQAISAPAHREWHPHLKIQEQRLMKKIPPTTNDTAKGDHLESTGDRPGMT